jgi:hypothetical protein
MDQTRTGGVPGALGVTGRAYRDAYEQQLRARVAPGETVDRFGPVIRRMRAGRAFILYRDLAGLEGAGLDAFIACQRDHFAGLVGEVEWKYHDGDLPADLPDRLLAAGFVPEERETVMVGDAALLTGRVEAPRGVRLREVTLRADLERIGRLEEAVWGHDHTWLVDVLERGLLGAGDPIVVVVAETSSEVVCAGWVRFHRGTEFATLWGGSTLEGWRRRGIYRAIVAYRARLAVERGFRYVQVDASAASRPILAGLGLRPAAISTPYVWRAATGA